MKIKRKAREMKTSNPLEPILELRNQDQIERLFALNPGEAWAKGKFRFMANKTASLIYERSSPSGYFVEEVDLRDENTWEWLQRLAANGLEAIKEEEFSAKEKTAV